MVASSPIMSSGSDYHTVDSMPLVSRQYSRIEPNACWRAGAALLVLRLVRMPRRVSIAPANAARPSFINGSSAAVTICDRANVVVGGIAPNQPYYLSAYSLCGPGVSRSCCSVGWLVAHRIVTLRAAIREQVALSALTVFWWGRCHAACFTEVGVLLRYEKG